MAIVPSASVAVTVKAKGLPVTVEGIPDSVPVASSKINPGGTLPEWVRTMGATPPVVVTV